MSTIACISLHQPYASLIAARLKPHETRSWPFPDRLSGQRIAIHASRTPFVLGDLPPGLLRACREVFGDGWTRKLPYGAFVATAVLDSQGPTEKVVPIGALDRVAGDWTPGRWAWLLRDVQRLDVPLPARGHRKWWSVPAETLGLETA